MQRPRINKIISMYLHCEIKTIANILFKVEHTLLYIHYIILLLRHVHYRFIALPLQILYVTQKDFPQHIYILVVS